MENKFSIICPIYNAEKYLSECINSVLTQTFSNWELILIDDKSTDNSLEICKKLKTEKIKILTNESNSGQYYSRIRGIKASTGNKILFLDADDTLSSGALEKLNKLIDEKKWDLISFNYSTFSNEGVSLRADRLISKNSTLETNDDVIDCYFCKCFLLSLCITCFDKRLFEDVTLSIKRQKFGEDALFLSEIIKGAQNACLICDALYNYRMVENSITHKSDSTLSLSRIVNLNKIYSSLSKKFRIQRKFFNRFTWAILNYAIDCSKEFSFSSFKQKIKDIKTSFIYKKYFSNVNLRSKKALLLVIFIKLNCYKLFYKIAKDY